jgi:hypothetical protein
MKNVTTRRGLLSTLLSGALVLAGVAVVPSNAAAQGGHVSKTFAGAKVNDGTVTHTFVDGRHLLALSADFEDPGTPDPHWQVVDSKGNVFLLQRLGIKGGKVNTRITLPPYVTDIVKVQIYCAWAEAVLGETTFDRTIGTN